MKVAALLIAVLVFGAVAVFQRAGPDTVDGGCDDDSAATTPEAARQDLASDAFAIGAAASPAPDPTVFASHLTVRTGPGDDLEFVHTFTVQLPAESPIVGRLLLGPGGDGQGDVETRIRDYRDALRALLGVGSFGGPPIEAIGMFFELRAEALFNDLTSLPRVTVSGDAAIVELPLPTDRLAGYPLSESDVGHWNVRAASGDLILTTKADSLQPSTIWLVGLCVEDLAIVSVASEEIPDQVDEEGHIAWTFRSGAIPTSPEVMVRLRPQPPTDLQLWLFSGERRYVAYAWSLLAPALLIVAAAMLVPRRLGSTVGFNRACRRFQDVAIGYLGLALAGALALALAALETHGGDASIAEIRRQGFWLVVTAALALLALGGYWNLVTGPANAHVRRWGTWLVPGLALPVAMAWTVAYGVVADDDWFASWRQLGRLLVAAAFAAFVVVAAGLTRRQNGGAGRPQSAGKAVESGLGEAPAAGMTMRDTLSVAPSPTVDAMVRQDSEHDRFGGQPERSPPGPHTTPQIHAVGSRVIALPGTGTIVGGIGLLGYGIGLLALSTPVWQRPTGAIPFWVVGGFVAAGSLAFVVLVFQNPWQLPGWWWSAWIFSAVVATAAILAQWARSVYAGLTVWERAGLVEAPRPRIQAFYDDYLSERFLPLPLQLLSPAVEVTLLLGLAGIAGVLGVAAGEGTSRLFWTDEQRWIRQLILLIFAAFVVGYGGETLGYRVPLAFLIALPLLAIVTRETVAQDSARIDEANAGFDDATLSAIAVRQRELLRRDATIVAVGRRLRDLFDEFAKGSLDEQSYRAKVGELEADLLHLIRGGWATGRTWVVPDDEGAGLVVLPRGVSPRDVVFAPGPRGDWWSNGILAVRLGAVLALLPLALYLWVLIDRQLPEHLSADAPFGVLALLTGVAFEVAFWLSAAFVLGALYPYLCPFRWVNNGVLKGASLAAVYAGANAVAAVLLPESSDDLWIVRSIQLLLFLTLLGVWLDFQTVTKHGQYWRHLLDHYRIVNARAWVAYSTPLLVTVAAVVRQLYSGETSAAIEQLINLPMRFLELPSF